MSVARISEPALFTVDDFFRMVQDGQKADLLDGVIHVASPDTPKNNQLANFILILMDGYADARDLGEVFASRVAFVLSELRAPEPDVAFVSQRRLENIAEGRIIGAPDIAVEIVSRDSRGRDYGEKKQLYEEAGVHEYWLIDPLQREAAFYRLEAGRFAQVPLERSRIFRSEALPGFWLDVEWLFAERLPSRRACLQEILFGEPAT